MAINDVIKQLNEMMKYYQDCLISAMNKFVEREVTNEKVKVCIEECRTNLQCAWVNLYNLLIEAKLVCSTGLCSAVAKWNSLRVCTCLTQSCAKNVMGSIRSARKCFKKFEEICEKLISDCQVKIVKTSENMAENDNYYTIYLAVTVGLAVASTIAVPFLAPVLISGVATCSSAVIVGGSVASAGGTVYSGRKTMRYRKQAEDIKDVKSIFNDVYKVATKLKEIGVVVMAELDYVNSSCESLMEGNCCSIYGRMNDVFRKLEDINKYVDGLNTRTLRNIVAANRCCY